MTSCGNIRPVSNEALYNQHVSDAAQAEIQSESAASFRSFSFSERVKLWLISWAGFLFIRVVGATLRYQFIPEPGCLADERGPVHLHLVFLAPLGHPRDLPFPQPGPGRDDQPQL